MGCKVLKGDDRSAHYQEIKEEIITLKWNSVLYVLVGEKVEIIYFHHLLDILDYNTKVEDHFSLNILMLGISIVAFPQLLE